LLLIVSDPKTPESIGQVPTDVADEMARRLFADSDPEPDERILFPGVGHGGLVEAVSRYCDRNNLNFPESVALETRENLVNQLRKRFDELPLNIRHLNFLGSLPDIGDFNYILSDPPVRDLSPDLEVREDLAMRFDTVSADGPGRDEDLYLAFFEQGL
jgi:hypothetical protein